jgi:hypothetical protein
VSKAKAELSSTIAERDRVGAEADLVSVHQPHSPEWLRQRVESSAASRYEQRVMSGTL